MLISQVEEADGAAPPKRARFEAAAPPLSVPAAALAPDVVCKALLLAVDAGECWPRFVAAGVASVDVLLHYRFKVREPHEERGLSTDKKT